MNMRSDLVGFAAVCAVLFGGFAVLAVGFDGDPERAPITPPPTHCYGVSAQLPSVSLRPDPVEVCDVVDAEGAGL